MAVTKLWPVKSNMANVAAYDINPLKTAYDEVAMPRGVPVADKMVELEDAKLIEGINCNPKTAINEFMDVKKKFDKMDGVLAYHGFVSFPDTDGLDPVNVLSVAREIAEEMWGSQFQVLLAVHTNTKTLHCHLLVNSVSYVDGHKAAHNEKNYYRLKNIADFICYKYDLTVPKQNERPPVDYPGLEDILVKCRMASLDVESLKENLAKHDIKYCGKNYVRLKDGRFVKLSRIKRSLEGLFDFAKASETKDKGSVALSPVESKKDRNLEEFTGRGV